MATEYKRMKQKVALAAHWTADNPTLLAGEIGYETDTRKFKIGDGINPWEDIPYQVNDIIDYDAQGLSTDTLHLWNEGFTNFQGASSSLAIGDVSPLVGGTIYRDLQTGGWQPHYAIDVEPIVSIHDTAPVVGVYSYPIGRATANSSLTAMAGTVQSYGNKIGIYTGNLILTGVAGSAYVRSQNETAAYGGDFYAFTGGNLGGTNTTPLYGIQAQADGGHNGTSPLVTAGKFIVSNVGGGGVGNITEAKGVEIVIDGTPASTNFTTAKGVAIEGWGAASGGTWQNSYAVYIDDTVDQGSINSFAIRSESTSDSLFDGPVRGPINAYNATTWNGSDKFATEDAVRDKIEAISLGATLTIGGSVTGGGDSRVLYQDTSENLAASGFFTFDPTNGFDVYTDGGASMYGAASVSIQSDNTVGLSTSQTVQIAGVAQITLLTNKFVIERTVTPGGTTGAQTINKAVGTVNFAAGQSSVVVTNSTVDANSLIFVTAQNNDAACKAFTVTKGAGTFTIHGETACAAETSVAFWVTN